MRKTNCRIKISSRLGINPCNRRPCRNGGSCEPNGGLNYLCLCPVETAGDECEISKLMNIFRSFMVPQFFCFVPYSVNESCGEERTYEIVTSAVYQAIIGQGEFELVCAKQDSRHIEDFFRHLLCQYAHSCIVPAHARCG